jgi:hypothetical protein
MTVLVRIDPDFYEKLSAMRGTTTSTAKQTPGKWESQ